MLPSLWTRARARYSSLLLAATAYIGGTGTVAAEAAPNVSASSAKLELAADAACATREDLIARVRARAPRARFADEGGGLSVRVAIAANGSGIIAGDVSLGNLGEKPSVRHVRARSCAEVSDAVALIIAVTLDPAAAEKGGKGASQQATAAAAEGAAAANESAAAASEPASRAAESDQRKPSSEPSPGADSLSSAPAARSRGVYAAQLAAEAFAGVAPGVMPSVALFVRAGFERPSAWSPSLMLGLHHAWRTGVEPGGNASFLLDAATLDACPLRLRFGVIEARPCGSLLFGRLSARATDTLNPAEESKRPFGVIGGAAVITAELSSLFELSARTAIGANLVRDSFEFTPATFHSVPAVSAGASLGLGVHWP